MLFFMLKFSFYNDIELEEGEVKILQELEYLIGEEIPSVKSAAMYNHGFSFENKKVTKLSLLKKGIDSLPDCIGDFTSLQTFGVWKNDLEYLPESIGKLTNLQKMWMQDNKLTSLPESIGNLTNLVELQIFNNPLKGLPESLSKLKNLEKLGINEKRTKNTIIISDNLKDWVEYLKSKGCKVNI